MKKNIIKLLLCAICVSSISLPAYAKEGVSTKPSQQETEIDTVRPSAHEMESKKVRIGKPIRKTFDLGAAGGQLPEGTSFEGGTGMLIWQDGGESTNLSVTIGGEAVGVTLDIGTAASGVGGKGIDVPGDGKFYKLGVRRNVKITAYKCYERLAGTDLPWRYVGVNSEVVPMSESFYLIEVR
ncbi:hypothetical protein [Anaerotignum sp. MB30-C6]|uniref:hypothetical protein n=1 Tax=Anaerotignum sp. MB30-C6 TaxID=3070814 RepID=UPI0027DE99B9|nr:hypothetical protein [Anaerotignum sp. MB30-C6]WMI81745.1 hypothetical protein RBQ60_03180 [Anaerotignum sp. MB30-C6]